MDTFQWTDQASIVAVHYEPIELEDPLVVDMPAGISP